MGCGSSRNARNLHDPVNTESKTTESVGPVYGGEDLAGIDSKVQTSVEEADELAESARRNPYLCPEGEHSISSKKNSVETDDSTYRSAEPVQLPPQKIGNGKINFSNSEQWWTGKQRPILKAVFRPGWLKTEQDSGDGFILQAAYADRYGDLSPALSVRPKTHTYKYAAGNLLAIPGARARPSQISKESETVNSFHKEVDGKSASVQNDKPKPASGSPSESNDFTMRLMDMVRRQYAVHSAKFDRVVKKAKEDYTICLFLSSPFDGCEKERKYFMESTVLQLNALCERKGVALNVVDMRWGITDELSSSNKTIRTCLQALDDSDIFIGYFGARYGSSNLIYETRPTWIDKSLDECSQSIYPYLQAYSDVSITEMEWLHAFTHDRNFEDPDKPICFFFFRDRLYDQDMEQRFAGESNERMAKVYRVENERSREAYENLRSKVKDLCSRIAHENDTNTRYGAIFDNYPNPLVGAKIMESCSLILMNEILLNINPPVKGSEVRQAHTAFAQSRLVMFIGFEEVLKTAQEYLQGSSSTEKAFPPKASKLVLKAIKRMDLKNKHLVARQFIRPLVIGGQSGGGKSSLMANLALRSNPEGSYVIYHFIGCNSGSTYLLGMLERLYTEFSLFVQSNVQEYGLTPFEKLESNSVLITICSVFEDLRDRLPPLVLLIDAINQLVDEPYTELNDLPSELKWLPKEFPQKMKVVLSCLDKCDVYSGEMLQVLKSQACNILDIGPLSVDLRKNIIFK